MKTILVGVAVIAAAVGSVMWFGYSPSQVDSTALATRQALQDAGVIQVWKSPTCGCCANWIESLEAAGFEVEAHDVDMAPIKAQYGIPGPMESCHTALVDGYLLEGHVPLSDIERLLKERPAITGLAVPGMVIGSLGMEMGDRVDPYDVLTFDGEGRTEVYSSHGR